MTDNNNAAEKLKQHFSSRVLHQVRQVIELWRLLPSTSWTANSFNDFVYNLEKLLIFAKRFDAHEHYRLASELKELTDHLHSGEVPDNQQLKELDTRIIELSRTLLRRGDDQNSMPFALRKPVYLALNHGDRAETMARQMQYFRLKSHSYSTLNELEQALETRHPAALVIGLDFGGKDQGLEIIKKLQHGRDVPLTVIFLYEQERPNLAKQIELQRQGGIALYQSDQVHSIIDEVEKLVDITPDSAHKVLVVDDSRSQATFSANTLNKAGILTEICHNPLEVLDKLQAFKPDLILLDMYMPNCTGMELARVIRQQREYINLPIIYLSGEEDRSRQLAAMAEGGEDFLTKPVSSEHLIATVNNRIKRAKELQNLIARDSLTGLLNHTHILGALRQYLTEQQTLPITFVMVDIDHFKQVNDRYGHPVGDQVIRNLSLFLRQHLRRSDPIGRYGGEEFAIVLVDSTEQQAIKIMNTIRASFANLQHDNQGLTVSFSCGLAQWQGESLSELVARADQALYVSKHQGRNRVTGASALALDA